MAWSPPSMQIRIRKALEAQRRGAVALLIVADVHNHPGPENFEALSANYWPAKLPRIERYALQTRVESIRVPVVQISRSAAAELLHGSERPLDALARAAESGAVEKALTFDDVTVTISTDVRRHVVPDRSVIAALHGSDPKLKDEWVVISSHHDHEGADGALIFNGADDNGSGTIGLIEIAEAYAIAARKGQRAAAVDPLRLVQLGRTRPPRVVGVRREASHAPCQYRRCAQHGHGRP